MADILDSRGKPIIREVTKDIQTAAQMYLDWDIATLDPGLRGGWIETGGLNQPHTSLSHILTLDLNRDLERKAARVAYMTNPIIWGAIEVIMSFVLGDGLYYNDTFDSRVDKAVSEFWELNALDEFIERWFTEFMVDGEDLTLYARGMDPSEPAPIGLYDVDDHLLLNSVRGQPHRVQSAEVKGENNNTITYQEGEFTWRAYDALWNDPRGWPVIMRAVGPAIAYIGFVNTRMRIHDIQSRINAIYHAFAQDEADLAAKAASYANLPKTGRVLTLHKLPTGEMEEFNFLETRTNATDSAADARLIRLVVSVATGIPEHYLGEGGDVNRTTADAMGAPAKKAFSRRQLWVKRYLDQLMRIECRRRYGERATYNVQRSVLQDNGGLDVIKSRVPIEQFDFGWGFPDINDEDAMGLVRRVQLAAEWGFASDQTLSSQLGYDYSAELERMPKRIREAIIERRTTMADPGATSLNQGVNRAAGRNESEGPGSE